MPIVSQAQRRWLHWAESEGKVPAGMSERWEDHTPKGKKLPERVMKKEAFFRGFEKRAADTLVEQGQPVPEQSAAGPDPAGGPQPTAAKMMKWNPHGGVDPRTPEEMAQAQAVDLITMPEGVEGAGCGSCQFFRGIDEALGTGFCTHPEVKLDVTTKMHCSRWNAPGTYRAWEAADPSAVPNAGMLGEADQLEQSGLPQAAAMQPPMAGGAPGQPGAEAGMPGEIAPGQAGGGAPGEGVTDTSETKAEKRPAKKGKDEKDAGGHTINVNLGEKKEAFWRGFEKEASAVDLGDRKHWLNDPPAHTDHMTPQQFRDWTKSKAAKPYLKMEMAE